MGFGLNNILRMLQSDRVFNSMGGNTRGYSFNWNRKRLNLFYSSFYYVDNRSKLVMPNKYEIIKVLKPGTLYKISIWDGIEDYGDYDKLFEELNKITEEDRVELSVNSSGGRCDVGFTLYDRISALPCIVDVIVPYPTYSMGAILALVGDSLTINPGSFLMFHDYSTGTRGKGNEIFKQMEASKEVFEYRYKETCQPFLTEKECESILNGRDKYIKWNDRQLKTRMKRHFK